MVAAVAVVSDASPGLRVAGQDAGGSRVEARRCGLPALRGGGDAGGPRMADRKTDGPRARQPVAGPVCKPSQPQDAVVRPGRRTAVKNRAEERNRLIEANMAMCHFVARKHPRLPYNDALSTATEALIRAATLFDESLGYKFSTYALKSIFRAVARLYRNRPVQLDVEHRYASIWLKDFVVTHEPETEVGREEVWAMLHRIDEGDAELIRSRFGLDTGEPKTLEQLGKEMGVSKERVRQRQNAILAQLKAMLQEEL